MKRLVLATGLLMVTFALSDASAATIIFSGLQTNNNLPASAGGPDCAGSKEVTIKDDGGAGPFFSTGSSNLGAFTTSQHHCLNAPPPLAPGASAVDYFNGKFDFFFADGTLSGSYKGLLIHDVEPGIVGNHNQTFFIDGGTGIFAGATGTLTGNGIIDFNGDLPVSHLNLSGQIITPSVPEPSVWTMLICGFGAIGGLMRRRRTTPAQGHLSFS
jgi:hypothetical protein